MAEVSVNFPKPYAAFTTPEELAAGVSQVLFEDLAVPDSIEPLRQLAQEALALETTEATTSDAERGELYRVFGDYVLTVAMHGQGYIPQVDTIVEDAKHFGIRDGMNKKLLSAKGAEVLTRTGVLSVPVQDADQAQRVLEKTFGVMRLVEAPEVPEIYLDPQKVMYLDYDEESGEMVEKEMTAPRFFQISAGTNEQQYAAELLNGAYGMYKTGEGLMVQLSAHPTPDDQPGNEITVTLANFKAPFVGQARPMTGAQEHATREYINALAEQLKGGV